MMGVEFESQVWAGCDNCGAWESTSHMKVKTFKEYLRKKGWRIGKVCLCPDCAELHKRKRADNDGK